MALLVGGDPKFKDVYFGVKLALFRPEFKVI